MKGRILILLAGVAAGAGCNESDDAFLAIQGAVEPNASCEVEGDPDLFFSSGVFDPRNGSAFQFTPNIGNRLEPTGDNNQEFFEDDALFPEGNFVRLIGFDVCYILASDSRLRDFGSVSSDGFPVDCESDNLRGEFVGESILIAPGSNGSLFSNMLDLDVLQTLFGADFRPNDIAPVGESGGLFSQRPQSPSADPRDPNWGDFPASGVADVFLIATAVAQRNNGSILRSDPFPYRVTVAPGAFDDFCGQLSVIDCGGGITGFSGQLPNEDSCIVSSGFEIQCEDINTCPATDGG